MHIVICGSLRFYDHFLELEQQLVASGHHVLLPRKIPGVHYDSRDGVDHATRVEAKARLGLIKQHMDKIAGADAILVANYTYADTPNRIGANTFAEIVYAHYLGKVIYLLNPLPEQDYIIEELLTINPVILEGDVRNI